MDLSDFIATTLISIQKGITEANRQTNKAYKIMPESKVVNFDVAIEIGREDINGKAGALKVKVVEGNIEKTSKTKESNTSRINFTVGVNTILT
jgi:dihydroxyacetone kinase DhaKLM complex PTS-EIIA-like component DhaM